MQMRVEQQGDKAITCPDDNSMIGRYFRERLNVEPGKPICANHFEQYGRHTVTFTKLNDELFYMDFSTAQETEE